MEIYILSSQDRDETTEILGAFSSIENVNKAIEGKTFNNRKFKGNFVGKVEAIVGRDVYDFFYLDKVTLDKEEI